MTISIIAAVAANNAIGKDNGLLWHLPSDMAYFMRITSGHCVVTGRKNYESIPEKFRPLVNRTNIIVSRNPAYNAPGAKIVPGIREAINLAEKLEEVELFVIGGGDVYRQTISLADKLYITRVAAEFEADTYFPDIDVRSWILVQSEFRAADNKNAYDMSFQQFTKK